MADQLKLSLIWYFNLLFLVCIDNGTVSKVGTRCFCLHNAACSISSLVSSCFVSQFSNDRKML